ncbi:hypothetical protein DFS34DRAFT_653633 [Phlyctochytrium arcticum]|nr:hypothetical protein DFS34DRAFT_653633 [Phlyctochytrium arcticum]
MLNAIATNPDAANMMTTQDVVVITEAGFPVENIQKKKNNRRKKKGKGQESLVVESVVPVPGPSVLPVTSDFQVPASSLPSTPSEQPAGAGTPSNKGDAGVNVGDKKVKKERTRKPKKAAVNGATDAPQDAPISSEKTSPLVDTKKTISSDSKPSVISPEAKSTDKKKSRSSRSARKAAITAAAEGPSTQKSTPNLRRGFWQSAATLDDTRHGTPTKGYQAPSVADADTDELVINFEDLMVRDNWNSTLEKGRRAKKSFGESGGEKADQANGRGSGSKSGQSVDHGPRRHSLNEHQSKHTRQQGSNSHTGNEMRAPLNNAVTNGEKPPSYFDKPDSNWRSRQSGSNNRNKQAHVDDDNSRHWRRGAPRDSTVLHVEMRKVLPSGTEVVEQREWRRTPGPAQNDLNTPRGGTPRSHGQRGDNSHFRKQNDGSPSHFRRDNNDSPRSAFGGPRKAFFTEHLSTEEVSAGLESGIIVRGSVRINRRNRNDAYVTVLDNSGTKVTTATDIYISGIPFRNRAFEGDVVAVQILEGRELELARLKVENFRDQQRQKNMDRQARCDATGTDEEMSNDEESDLELIDNVTAEPTPAAEEVPVDDRTFGKVVAILERRRDLSFAGTLCFDPFQKPGAEQSTYDRPSKYVWFKSCDHRVPFIMIPVHKAPKDFLQDPSAFSKILFSATVTNWPAHSQQPYGAVVGTLGQMGEIAVETAALLVDANVTWNEFPDSVLDCLPPTPWKIPESELAKRRDFRNERIFSIDPATARDLDDAVSVKRLPDGNFEVGVHIADVSYFVEEQNALDKEAAMRATTVYLVQKVIPMLPRLLCEELCSLNPDVERLAFSVTWKMDARARILEAPWFGRSVIKSCAKLSYEHAQRFIEGKDWEGLPDVGLSKGTTIEDIKEDTLRLYEFSKFLRERRCEEGALSMHNIKLWFSIDPLGNPMETGVYELKDSNRLIEEFMLLANMAVAQKLVSVMPHASLLRNHPPPLKKAIEEFVVFAGKIGYTLDATSSGSLQKSFDAIKNPLHREVLRQLCIRPMQRAMYFCTGSTSMDNWRHYALAVPVYTHFTSPIRRYCDLVVHRMLQAVLDFDASGKSLDAANTLPFNPKDIAAVATRCNDCKEASKMAQDASQNLYLCAYLARLCKALGTVKDGLLVDAVICTVGTRAYDVLIPAYGIESRVWLEDSIETGEVVGCEEIANMGNAGAGPSGLRVFWKKDGVPEKVVEPETAVSSPSPRPPGTPTTKRRVDLKTVESQTIRLFDPVVVRVVPILDKSPPTFKVHAVRPGTLATEIPNGILREASKVSTDALAMGYVDVDGAE